MKRFLYDFLSKNAMLLCLLFCTSANLSAQNNAVSLNGTSQSAYANPLLPSANEITMEGWFNWTGSTGNNQVLFYNGNSGSSGYGLMIIPGDANKLNIVCGGWVVQTTGITIPTPVV